MPGSSTFVLTSLGAASEDGSGAEAGAVAGAGPPVFTGGVGAQWNNKAPATIIALFRMVRNVTRRFWTAVSVLAWFKGDSSGPYWSGQKIRMWTAIAVLVG